jgi:hypothetical protein
MVGCK